MKWYIILRRWTWELPQSLLGLILLPFYNRTKLTSFIYKDQRVYLYDKFPGGVSLGYYTLLDYNKRDWNNLIIRESLKKSVKHESGHGVQSKWLGPLYLLIVGLPSAIHNLICRYKRAHNIPYNYYEFFIEKQADKLGGVIR